MKILFVDKQDSAGMGTYSAELIRFLTRKAQTVIPLRFGQALTAADPKNTILLPYLAGGSATYLIPRKETVEIFKKVVAEQKPDLIHLSLAISPLDFYIPRLAQRLGIPTVGLLHAGFSAKKISWQNLGIKSFYLSYLPCLSKLGRILVFSKAVADFLAENKIEKKRLVIMPNAVDIARYCPGSSFFKKKNRLEFGYLFLGRLDRQKNPDLLIESFLNLSPPPAQKLIIVGKGTIGSLGKDLRKRFARHRQIIFTGEVADPKEKIDIIRAADVFVQPSLFEGMSFSLLETMACGLAPITTDAGNHQEIVGDSGIVIEHDKIKSQLPIALQIFSKNPYLGKTLGKRARKIVVQKYNLNTQTNQLIKIYRELVSQKKRKSSQKSFLRKIFWFWG